MGQKIEFLYLCWWLVLNQRKWIHFFRWKKSRINSIARWVNSLQRFGFDIFSRSKTSLSMIFDVFTCDPGQWVNWKHYTRKFLQMKKKTLQTGRKIWIKCKLHSVTLPRSVCEKMWTILVQFVRIIWGICVAKAVEIPLVTIWSLVGDFSLTGYAHVNRNLITF